MLKKIAIIIIIFIITVNVNIMSFADDIIEENKNDVSNTIETVSEVNDTHKEPKINSRAAIVLDRKSKKVIYGKNENVKKAMASTTKIMTAMVVIQNTNLDNIVEVSKKAAGTGGSRLGLKAGDKISVKDLLYGLLLRSGNDCAVALAEYIGGSIEGFAKLMNQNAENLGLENTNFVTPHGLDAKEHYTTAYELALLADYALENQAFSKIVNSKTYTIRINKSSKTLNNTNELLGVLDGVYGVKTGFTNGAGRCLVTSIKRGELDVICVVLGADTKKDRTRDSVKLIQYTFNNYEEIDLTEKIKEEFENWNIINKDRIYIEKADTNNLNLAIDLNNDDKIVYPIKKGNEDKVYIDINANLELEAPISSNTKLGEIVVKYDGEIIKKIDIININSISRKRMIDYIENFWHDYNIFLKTIIN